MAKFAIFFSYTPDAWKTMLANPSDRSAAARELSEAVGGRLEAFYWMFGEWDGFGIGDMPDSTSAGAVSVAVAASGAFSKVSTHELLDADGRDALIAKAHDAVASYSPPTG